MNNSKKPNLAIIGGSKISTKIDLLYNLIEKCDVNCYRWSNGKYFFVCQGN